MKIVSKSRNILARAKLAFTLIEMLMVIAIIGILAALLIGSAGYAGKIMKMRRVTAELKQLETAIGAYKAALGSYPPDNPGRPDQPPLLYELLGMRTVAGGNVNGLAYTNGVEVLSTNNARLYLGVLGIQNTVMGTNDSAIKTFLPFLKSKQATNHPTATAIKVLVVPVDGPGGSVNPWRYVSTNPTNNPQSYDLWAELVIAGKTYVIGNWKN